MLTVRSVHIPGQTKGPESFKREPIDQALAGTLFRHVAETLSYLVPMEFE